MPGGWNVFHGLHSTPLHSIDNIRIPSPSSINGRRDAFILAFSSNIAFTASLNHSTHFVSTLPLSLLKLSLFRVLPVIIFLLFLLFIYYSLLRYSVLLLLFFYYSCFSSIILYWYHALSVSYSLVISNLVVAGIYSHSLLLLHPVLAVYGTIVEPSVRIAGGLPTTAQPLVQLPDRPPLQIDLRSHWQEHGRNDNPRFGNGTAPVYAASIFALLWWDVMGGRRIQYFLPEEL